MLRTLGQERSGLSKTACLQIRAKGLPTYGEMKWISTSEKGTGEVTVVSYAYAVWVYVGCVNNKFVDIRHFGDDRYNSIMHACKQERAIPIKTSRCIRTCNTCNMTLCLIASVYYFRELTRNSSSQLHHPWFNLLEPGVSLTRWMWWVPKIFTVWFDM